MGRWPRNVLDKDEVDRPRQKRLSHRLLVQDEQGKEGLVGACGTGDYKMKCLCLLLAPFVFIAVVGGYACADVFTDDFDDEDYAGWTVQKGTWAVENGELNCNSTGLPDTIILN